MSDSFADLWNSAAPVKPAEPPKKLGALSASSATSTTRKPTNDVFSLLANTSSTSSRSVTPSYSSSNPQSAASSRPNVVQKTSSAGSGGDAFSSLLSGTLASSSAANTANMTMAQRAAQAERQKSEQLLRQQKTSQHTSAAWAGLDALGASTPSGTNGSSSNTQEDEWGFEFASPAPQATQPKRASSAPKATVAVDDDDWGLGDFGSQPAPSKAQPTPVRPAPVSQKSTGSLWDLDEFTSPSSQDARKPSPEPPINRSSTPGDFDFGDREDGLLNDRSDDEDDILGDLGKPVDRIKVTKAPSVRSGLTIAVYGCSNIICLL